MRTFPFIAFLFSSAAVPFVTVADSADIYSRRVLPLLRTPTGSSCKECHFSGVELNDVFSENEAGTFAALKAAGWVNVKNPDQSKLLTFINRHGKKTAPEIREVRKKEKAAITAWLASAVANPQLLSHKPAEDVGVELDEKLIRHLRSDRILARFTENIWSVMGQCINCHSPERNKRQVEKHGEQMSWITPHDPEATLHYLVESGLIDQEDPDASDIRTKPTAIAEHGGGPKFPAGSATDKRFLTFLRDYANVLNGKYTSIKHLPPTPTEHTQLTENYLRLIHLPKSWGRKLLRVDLFAQTVDGWTKERIATGDNFVAPKRLRWQSPMWSVASAKNQLVTTLTPSRYLARIYVDREGRLEKDADAEFTKADIVATVEFSGAWNKGWKEPKIVDATQSKLD